MGIRRQLLNDAGHVTASASYDPYGTPEGAALPSPFGYSGELTDPATGSEYLRARWYRPGQGALLGVDPDLDTTGQPYGYAGDNPANGSDPSGQCTVSVAGTQYSYLGAEGPGPCSTPLASSLAGAYRADGAIPCLRVLQGRVELVGAGVSSIFVGQPDKAGFSIYAATALPFLGAPAVRVTLAGGIVAGAARGAAVGAEEGGPGGIFGTLVGVAIGAVVGVAIAVIGASLAHTGQKELDGRQSDEGTVAGR